MKIQIIASGSSGNAYLINDGKTSLLLDAGLSIKKIKEALNFNLGQVKGIFITHEHGDHAKAVKELVKYGKDVYLTQGTKDALGLESHRLKIVKSCYKVICGSYEVYPFDIVHDAKEPVGFLIYSTETKEKLLYMTDTMYCKYRFNGLDYMMIEVNFDYEIVKDNVLNKQINQGLAHRIYKSHMSLDSAIAFIKANKGINLKEIYLLHLSDSNSDAKRFKEKAQEITGVEVYTAN